VIEPLAAGGMGQVYLAEDVRLGRKLALKVLPPRATLDEVRVNRFEREARTISALNHPNIITIYDVGEVRGLRFIATEFIEGVTVRTLLGGGRLEVRQALRIAVQVAEALAVAHAAGVVHRDLKPENVMVRADGHVKVLDFGLAKLTAAELVSEESEAATRAFETAEGIVMGTVRYMAPEQARGEEIDARADVFALGVLLYEMLAGIAPFSGPSAADIVSALLIQEPPPLAQVPGDLARTVMRALRKKKSERHESCALLLDEPAPPSAGARTTSAGHATSAAASPVRRRRAKRVIDSLAVLPLAPENAERDLEYLSEGLTVSLINSLSQLPRLRVMARSTVFRYTPADADACAVGRELQVSAVLTGRITQRGEAFAISAELVDVEDGSQLWGAVLHRPAADIPTLQADLARELGEALRLRLTRDQKRRLTKRHTVSASAYQQYLRGQYLSNMRTSNALLEAQQLFEGAVREDPDYALAYAGLADCRSLIAVNLRPSTVAVTIRQAREAASRALELDDTLAEGHASLAFIKFRFDWDWAGAEAEFARAIGLNSGHAPTRQWHAMFLASRARFDAALAEMHRALDLDPLSLVIQTGIGRILHFARRFDEALAQYDHVLRINPAFGQTYIDLALTRLAMNDFVRSREALTRADELSGGLSTVLLLRGICAVREGLPDEARQILRELRQRYEHGAAGVDDLALLAATLGEWDLAIEWLKEACARRAPFLGYVDVEPAMAPLLHHPATRALLQRHGFDAVAR
jgi:serine/threonine-protein kinase